MPEPDSNAQNQSLKPILTPFHCILKNCFLSEIGFGNQYLRWSQPLNAGDPTAGFLLLEPQTSKE